jgi:predicted PurR-regulated permease PerM
MNAKYIHKLAYIILAALLIIAGWFNMAPAMIVIMLSYLALSALSIKKKKWIGVALFFLLLSIIVSGISIFSREAIIVLPQVIADSIPKILAYAKNFGINLPFSDLESLRGLFIQKISEQVSSLSNFAKLATKEFVHLMLSIIIAISIFMKNKIDFGGNKNIGENNLYTQLTSKVASHFRTLYRSFVTVMGAQIIISAINTLLTSIFVYSVGIPYAFLVTVITFILGLLPIVGNIISNGIIFCIAFTASPMKAFLAIGYLIAIHQLEYFLNSKIIGERIQTPMWLTLVVLIIGESILGIPGMILAPVLLHFLQVELQQVKITK